MDILFTVLKRTLLFSGTEQQIPRINSVNSKCLCYVKHQQLYVSLQFAKYSIQYSFTLTLVFIYLDHPYFLGGAVSHFPHVLFDRRWKQQLSGAQGCKLSELHSLFLFAHKLATRCIRYIKSVNYNHLIWCNPSIGTNPKVIKDTRRFHTH